MKGFVLIGMTVIGSAVYGINQLFKKFDNLDILSVVVIFLGLFCVYRLTIYALSKEGK